ncbi:MAG: sugar transferase [candidate division KSB1 bacterium]|nr:sugar transferase [candidate division KSB1 bacterium]
MLDWLLLNASWAVMRSFFTSASKPAYFHLLLLINGAWLLTAFWEQKATRMREGRLLHRVLFMLKNAAYMLYIVSVVLVLLSVTGFSRKFLLGGFMLYGLLSSMIVIGDRLWGGKKAAKAVLPVSKPLLPHARPAMIDFFLFTFSFAAVHYLKYGTLSIAAKERDLFLLFSAVWLATAVFTDKFRFHKESNFYYEYGQYFKSGLIAAALMSLVVYGLRLFRYSRTLIFGTLLLLMTLEAAVLARKFLRRRAGVAEEDIETVENVREFVKKHELPEEPAESTVTLSAARVLEGQGLADYPEVYDFLRRQIDLESIDFSQTRVYHAETRRPFAQLAPASLKLFINLEWIGRIPRPNEYFLQVHSKLKNNGWFLVRKERLEDYRERLQAKYPPIFAGAVYLMHFFLHRMCPKLPILKTIYEAANRNRIRVMTRAELLGRLRFCGFKPVAFEYIGDSHWFLVQKSDLPSPEANPSHGMLIRLRRVGYRGRIFRLYKLRTMHPYAEFLQDYVHETQSLDDSGKFKDDFRVTQWGKVLRKYWIDELPQLINFIRGDIRLFGVRAISEHYFSLYPPDVQQLRLQVKPGLIPPYYADMPRNFNEIVESERRYLLAKLKQPFKTDWIYFWRALNNILLKRAHSR